MKYVKMLGLAAVAAMALMAFLGAGSASATVFCKTNVTVHCPTGWHYNAKTPFDASLEAPEGQEKVTAILEVGATILDTCTGSTVQGETENTGSTTETIGIKVTKLTWESCTRPTTTLKLPTLEVHHVTNVKGVDGTVTVKEAEVTVNTIFGSCIYGYGSEAKDIGTLTSGNPATFKVTTEVPKISGPCPGTSAKWTAAYLVTEPKPLFISEGKEGDPV